MNSVQVLSFLGLFAAIFVLGKADPFGRLYDGQPVDNLRQFPHHVYINVTSSGQKCGGSILNKHWIVTSASCVKDAIRLELFFRKKQQYDEKGDYFSLSVNRAQIFVYPTNYDDIALVKVPITLDFSDNLAPINVSTLPIEALRGRFTVMPGFSDPLIITTPGYTTTTPCSTTTEGYTCPPNAVACTTSTPPPTTTYYSTTTTMSTTTARTTTTPCYFNCPSPNTEAPEPPHLPPNHDNGQVNNLKYGMFNVLENRVCKQIYGGAFDEYTQLCIGRWGDNPNRPCESDYGSGLVVGWPAKSELVGLFSMYSPGCESTKPSIFTFMGKYMGWIESLIQG